MSLEQNAKKIKPHPEINPEKEIISSYLVFWSVGIMLGLFVWLIWQLVLLNNSYNLSNRTILIEKSRIVGEVGRTLPLIQSITAKTYLKNFYIAASKTGTKYYYKNCAGLGRIKHENLTFFVSESQAEGAGYTLAKNCLKPQK